MLEPLPDILLPDMTDEIVDEKFKEMIEENRYREVVFWYFIVCLFYSTEKIEADFITDYLYYISHPTDKSGKGLNDVK